MTLESVKKHIEEAKIDVEMYEMEGSTATVELAAEALDVEPGRIAKSMAIRLKERDILILAKGDVRLDNRKFKDTFKQKARFISGDDIFDATGHPVGGVCPFGLSKPIDIYLDESLKVYDYVYPAAGSPNACIKIDVDYLRDVVNGEWVDVCK
ncbi:YbaK/EbsC family protein [Gudongella sp. DL1XJH-153]|uniref:YbaK/EbsC family protein n=1 Tax=Gudongella sp. DL1XJH-153 TaxID=3409804 RepID=UPI003BB55E34